MHCFTVQHTLPFISGFQWLNYIFYPMRQTETRQQLMVQIKAVLGQILHSADLKGVTLGKMLKPLTN